MTAIEKPALAISRRSERGERMAEKPGETPVLTDSSGNRPDNVLFSRILQPAVAHKPPRNRRFTTGNDAARRADGEPPGGSAA
jgi:hypothetical protein